MGKFTNFNGDDAVGLFKDGTLIDIIGNMELVKFGEIIILRRKATITAPSAIYNPEEWESIKIAGTAEDVSGLGSHTMNWIYSESYIVTDANDIIRFWLLLFCGCIETLINML